MAKVNRRDQVKKCLEAGTYTKAAMAEEIGVSAPSISSQMTYLRWMGNFIKYDENKVLAFCTEEEYDAWQEELAANRKSKSASSRTPEEQSEAVFKAIKRQEASIATWTKKHDLVLKDLEGEPDDDELLELEAEAAANLTLLAIKMKRNVAKQEDLPDYVEPEEDAAADEDVPEDSDEELL